MSEFRQHGRARNKKSGQVYQVLKINPDGTLFLYKRNRPRVRNADPANWEPMPELEPLAGTAPPAPDVVVYHLSREPVEANTP
jgi:hypothetical protein